MNSSNGWKYLFKGPNSLLMHVINMGGFPNHIESVLFWLLCTLMFNSVLCSFNAHCNEKDMNALRKFKQGVTDPTNVLSSWLTEKDCCQWKGIRCDNITGRVTELSLPCNAISSAPGDEVDKSRCLTGELELSLLDLRSIKSLNLSGNSISGPIPDWLGQLEHLQELDLSYNSLSGQIPTSLGNLSSLIALHLESNQFSGSLPESLGQLLNLEVLAVGDNPLTGTVSDRNFVHLSNLKHLFLSSPTLSSNFDPKWFPPFELEGIQLGYMGVPSWLFTQSSLKRLTITDSVVSFEPHDKFWNFAELEYLCLENNLIKSNVSRLLLNATVTVLSTNYLRGGLPQISSNVIALDLHNNYFSGSISPLLCHQMEGESKLEYLDISGNHLSGELTNCWIQWKSLVYVHLGRNNLTGKIPHSMGLLPNLSALGLNDNKFFGEAPMSLKNCQNLLFLDLGGNKLSGPIPNWIGQGVKVLSLRSNEFSGHIPQQICQLNSLMVLDFANNRLSGPIPDCLRNMTAMVSSNIPFNRFRIKEADIPWRVFFPIKLVTKGFELEYTKFLIHAIDLSSNNLSGAVPLEVFKLSRLVSLNLSHNQLVGMIPQEVGSLKDLESLDLSWNLLSGQIPQSMVSLYCLEFANFSFNNFMGQIPSENQFSVYSSDCYVGNPELCGPPLTKSCMHYEIPHNTKLAGEDNDGQESEVHSWFFYLGFVIGFATWFSTVLGVIFFNSRCKSAYFKFLDRLFDMIIQKINRP